MHIYILYSIGLIIITLKLFFEQGWNTDKKTKDTLWIMDRYQLASESHVAD